jgi:hypothetical protein
MATTIKAWIATPEQEPHTRIHTQIVACNGGQHFHLFASKEFQYESLAEADIALTDCMLQASAQYGVLAWADDTDAYDDNIVRGDN